MPGGQHPLGGAQQLGGGPGGDSAARVLALAQQTADQAIAEARSEANKIVGEARTRAEGMERDARAKADALERDAQEKHRVAMGSLESARATLERKVDDLRAFEREYRTRLKSYLDSQLRQLEAQADDSLAPPRTPATASLPPAMSAPSPVPSPMTPAMTPSIGQQMAPAMTQQMAPVRPQAPQPQPLQQAPMRGFLLEEDSDN
jgi:vacuolar-type H+-ATPase subunit H